MNCPECDFKTKWQNKFEGHAVKNHPLSKTIFGYDKDSNDEEITLEEIMYPDLDEAEIGGDHVGSKIVLIPKTSKRKKLEDFLVDIDELEGNIELSD